MPRELSTQGPRLEWLNYHHLLCFWLVARRGGLAAAGRELYVSPSTVWSQLKAVEERLGVRLLVKRGRRLTLTEAGERVAQLADEIFTLGQQVFTVARDHAAEAPRPLRVGVSSAVPRLVASRFLAPVLGRHRLVVTHGCSAWLTGELRGHALDVVLTHEAPPADGLGKLYAHPFGVSRLALYASAQLKERLLPEYPASLDGAPLLVLNEGYPQQQALTAFFSRLKVAPMVVAETDDGPLLKALAAAGHGVVAAPALVRDELARIYALDVLAHTDVPETYFALTHQDRPELRAVDAMLDQPAIWKRP
ncbi:MAG: LysR family transcriptional regulator [Myxococcaceae bacterium]|nr:LysR family transcriptional regulator [Myxococcaceae bacterium]